MNPMFVLTYFATLAGGLWLLAEIAFAAVWSPTPKPPKRIWVALTLCIGGLLAMLAMTIAWMGAR